MGTAGLAYTPYFDCAGTMGAGQVRGPGWLDTQRRDRQSFEGDEDPSETSAGSRGGGSGSGSGGPAPGRNRRQQLYAAEQTAAV